ncbi:MAG TPA: glycosyltransferase family 87 protein [Rhizomicrobium sp.]|jgi:alpha-1,2-mannosyltransferase|nr:glycosyltransferase family 87 protein [Rhizomicrobium sp.]
MTVFLMPLRDGRFLTPRVLRAYPLMLMAGFAVAILFLGLTAHGVNDYAGRPLGTDFSNIYAAGLAALKGNAASVFDIQTQWHNEQALFGAATQVYGWHYPPFFLLVAAPLALLPYQAALIVWQLSTLILYLWALKALIRKSAVPQWAESQAWLPLALGFTAVFVNLTHGHNGFLTVALFAGGLANLNTRPLVGGLLFGLLAYKPQFGAMIPLALAAGHYWRSFAAAAVTVLFLALAVTFLFGAEVWPAFLAGSHFTRTVILEQGATGFEKIQTFFSQVRLLGGPIALAYAVQGVAYLFCALMVIWAWRKSLSFGTRGAILCLATLIATPYALDYDLMLLAPALVLIAAEGKVHGFRPYELSLLTLLWLLPFAARNLAAASHLLVAPLAILALLVMTGRRTRA